MQPSKELEGGATGTASGVPVTWLLAAAMLLISAQNLLLWRFLGFSNGWAYGAGALAIAGLSYSAKRAWRSSPVAIISYRRLLFCLLLAAALLVLGGQGRLFYANLDWQVRDAVLRDLALYPWPFVYLDRGEAELLRAPLGMYLTPAATAKVLGLQAGDIALLVQNTLLLGALIATASLLFDTARRRACALAIFVLFSGMDILGALLLQSISGASGPLDHIEFWSGIQYSSHITLLFWVPQHGLAGWTGALLFLLWKRDQLKLGFFLAAVPILALWSPLAGMGIVPFAAYAGITELLGRRITRFDLSVPAFALLLAAPSLAYLLAAGDSVGIRLHSLGNFQVTVFTSLEVLPYLVAVAVLTPISRFGAATFLIAAICLLLIPFVRIGEGFDFMMRVSIPSLAILSVLVADALMQTDPRRLPAFRRVVAIGLVLTLLVGAVTPLLELRRAFAFAPQPMTECNLVNSWSQVVGLDQTSGATYFAPLAKVPAAIRPAEPSRVREQAKSACWSQPWQTSR